MVIILLAEFVDLPLEVAVLRDLRPVRDGQLQQNGPAPMLRIELEETLEGSNAFWNPLRVVQSIRPEDDALPAYDPGRGGCVSP